MHVSSWCRATRADRSRRKGGSHHRAGSGSALASDVLRLLRAGDGFARGGRAAGARGGGAAAVRRRGARGWAACRLWSANFFDGLEPDGHTPIPVPLALGEHGRIRADNRVTLSNERLGNEVVDLHGIRSTRRERATFDEMRRTPALRESVVALDMMASAELTTIIRMRTYAAGRSRWKRVGQVRKALDLASEHSRHPTRLAFGSSSNSTPASRRSMSTARSMIATGACSALRTCWTSLRAWSSSTTGQTTEVRSAITRTSRRSIGSGGPDSRWRG